MGPNWLSNRTKWAETGDLWPAVKKAPDGQYSPKNSPQRRAAPAEMAKLLGGFADSTVNTAVQPAGTLLVTP